MKKDKAIVFGSTVRLKIFACLSKGPKTVNQLIKNCQLSQSAVSQHLKKLKILNLVSKEKKGREVLYFLKDKFLGKISQKLLVYLKNL